MRKTKQGFGTFGGGSPRDVGRRGFRRRGDRALVASAQESAQGFQDILGFRIFQVLGYFRFLDILGFRYFRIQDILGFLWVSQRVSVDFHTWAFSRLPCLECFQWFLHGFAGFSQGFGVFVQILFIYTGSFQLYWVLLGFIGGFPGLPNALSGSFQSKAAYQKIHPLDP